MRYLGCPGLFAPIEIRSGLERDKQRLVEYRDAIYDGFRILQCGTVVVVQQNSRQADNVFVDLYASATTCSGKTIVARIARSCTGNRRIPAYEI